MLRHTRLTRLALPLALATLLAAETQAQGTVIGAIVDASSGRVLAGATISLADDGRTTRSDQDGRFIFLRAPVGRQTVTARYIGYAPDSAVVTVEPGITATVTLRLAPKRTELETIVVTGTRQGQAAALTQQGSALNITNVVAADQIGRFPDQNIGDALKRIPGFSTLTDQGEARFGFIRGTEPRFNSFMLNGERIPSAEAETRAVQLDLVSADMVQAVEVNKTLTPEMDGDAIGGSVNIVTRAAPVEPRFSLTLGSGYNPIRSRASSNFNLVGGNRMVGERLGAVVSLTRFDNPSGSDDIEGVWDLTAAGSPYLAEMDVRTYERVHRLRESGSVSLDYRLNDNNTVLLRSVVTRRRDWENRYRLRYSLSSPDDGPVEANINRQTKGGGPGTDAARLEDQRTYSHALTGEHVLRAGIITDWSIAMSQASEDRPDERYIDWRASAIPVSPSISDPRKPVVTVSDPAAVTLDQFAFYRGERYHHYTEDRDRAARLDFTVPVRTGPGALTLKVGGRYRAKDKMRNNVEARVSPLNGAYPNLSTAATVDVTRANFQAGSYSAGAFADAGFLEGLAYLDPAQWQYRDRAVDYLAANFDAKENVSAGYAQLTVEARPTLSFIGGVRFERTTVENSGHEYDEETDATTPTTGRGDYTNLLPSLQMRAEVLPATIVRASISTGLARPNYYDLVPYRLLNSADNTLALGNPNLKATRSVNYDLSIERYLESVGLLSLGAFAKDISDFTYSYVAVNGTDPATGQTFSLLTQPRNGTSATLVGFEASVQRSLDFLPGALRWMSAYANYTFNDSRVKGLGIPGRENERLPLPGTSRHSGNASVAWDHPRASLRLSANHQAHYSDPYEGGYGSNRFFDRYIDDQTFVDFNAQFTATPRARVYFEAVNLTNQPLRAYQGSPEYTAQAEYYRARFQTGVKLDW